MRADIELNRLAPDAAGGLLPLASLCALVSNGRRPGCKQRQAGACIHRSQKTDALTCSRTRGHCESRKIQPAPCLVQHVSHSRLHWARISRIRPKPQAAEPSWAGIVMCISGSQDSDCKMAQQDLPIIPSAQDMYASLVPFVPYLMKAWAHIQSMLRCWQNLSSSVISRVGLAWVMGVPPEVREPWGSWKARRDRTMPSDVKNRMWSWSITCITSSIESLSRRRAPALPAAIQNVNDHSSGTQCHKRASQQPEPPEPIGSHGLYISEGTGENI